MGTKAEAAIPFEYLITDWPAGYDYNIKYCTVDS